jgi:hypothetical protein
MEVQARGRELWFDHLLGVVMKITANQLYQLSDFVEIAREHVAPGIERFDIALTKARAVLGCINAAIPEEDRCGNCDHHSDLHKKRGCTVVIQSNGESIPCPCRWNKRQASSLQPFPPFRNVLNGMCELCGQPMPEGEEMFKYHGYSGSCPTKSSQ